MYRTPGATSTETIKKLIHSKKLLISQPSPSVSVIRLKQQIVRASGTGPGAAATAMPIIVITLGNRVWHRFVAVTWFNCETQ